MHSEKFAKKFAKNRRKSLFFTANTESFEKLAKMLNPPQNPAVMELRSRGLILFSSCITHASKNVPNTLHRSVDNMWFETAANTHTQVAAPMLPPRAAYKHSWACANSLSFSVGISYANHITVLLQLFGLVSSLLCEFGRLLIFVKTAPPNKYAGFFIVRLSILFEKCASPQILGIRRRCWRGKYFLLPSAGSNPAKRAPDGQFKHLAWTLSGYVEPNIFHCKYARPYAARECRTPKVESCFFPGFGCKNIEELCFKS